MTVIYSSRVEDAFTVAKGLTTGLCDAVEKRDVPGENVIDVLVKAFDLAVRNIEKNVDQDFRWLLIKRLAQPRIENKESE